MAIEYGEFTGTPLEGAALLLELARAVPVNGKSGDVRDSAYKAVVAGLTEAQAPSEAPPQEAEETGE